MTRIPEPRLPIGAGVVIGAGLVGAALAFVVLFVALALLLSIPCVWTADSDTDDDRETEPPDERCRQEELRLLATFGPNGPVDGRIELAPSQEDVWCRLPASIDVRLVSGQRLLPMDLVPGARGYEVVVGISPDEKKRRGALVLPGAQERTAWYLFRWENWCADPVAGSIEMVADIPGVGSIRTTVARDPDTRESAPLPACTSPAEPSRLDLRPGLHGDVITRAEDKCQLSSLTVRNDLYFIDPGSDRPWSEYSARSQGGGIIENLAGPLCALPRVASARFSDGSGQRIDVRVKKERSRVLNADIVGPQNRWAFFHWTNWCGSRIPGPLRMTVLFDDDYGELTFEVFGTRREDGYVPTPPCLDDDDPSRVEVFEQ